MSLRKDEVVLRKVVGLYILEESVHNLEDFWIGRII